MAEPIETGPKERPLYEGYVYDHAAARRRFWDPIKLCCGLLFLGGMAGAAYFGFFSEQYALMGICVAVTFASAGIGAAYDKLRKQICSECGRRMAAEKHDVHAGERIWLEKIGVQDVKVRSRVSRDVTYLGPGMDGSGYSRALKVVYVCHDCRRYFVDYGHHYEGLKVNWYGLREFERNRRRMEGEESCRGQVPPSGDGLSPRGEHDARPQSDSQGAGENPGQE